MYYLNISYQERFDIIRWKSPLQDKQTDEKNLTEQPSLNDAKVTS